MNYSDPKLYTLNRRSPASRPSRLFPRSLFRFASHGLVLSVALAAVVTTTHQATPILKQNASDKAVVRLQGPPAPEVLGEAAVGYLHPTLALETKQTPASVLNDYNQGVRRSVITYGVQDGDVLSGIAAKFGVTTMSLVWANDFVDPDSLKPGSEVLIPPTSGVLHKVKDGDTLASLAEKYRVAVQDITAYPFNTIRDPDALTLDQYIMVPGAERQPELPTRLAAQLPAAASAGQVAPVAAAPAPQAAAVPPPAPAPAIAAPDSTFGWPAYGQLSQGFAYGHRGLDIAKSYGSPIVAAGSGVVAWVQYLSYGYGYHLLIDHGNGYQTLYAHFQEVFVAPGQRVSRGEQIGRMGATGLATGPHLHFEVHLNGMPVNPMAVLP